MVSEIKPICAYPCNGPHLPDLDPSIKQPSINIVPNDNLPYVALTTNHLHNIHRIKYRENINSHDHEQVAMALLFSAQVCAS